jgi:hypothetical protein
MDKERYMDVLRRLEYQAAQAAVWRDTINDWFYRMSGIADPQGRVGRGRTSQPRHDSTEQSTIGGSSRRRSG